MWTGHEILELHRGLQRLAHVRERERGIGFRRLPWNSAFGAASCHTTKGYAEVRPGRRHGPSQTAVSGTASTR